MTDSPFVLRNLAAFDHDARRFNSGVDILCDRGRIVAIGPGLPAPAEALEVDASGLFALPGLIDCHVHISSSGAPGDLNRAGEDPVAIRALKAAQHARVTLDAGFTTVRDLGAPAHLNVHLSRAIADGLIEGPSILAAGMGVTMTGGHGHGFLAREADGPDDVRKAVREQLRAGATAIKLFASGGVMTAGVDPRSPSFTLEELTAGVEEAHKAFRVVASHAQATDGIKNAVRAGVDSIEHGVWLDEEAIGLMLERGTYLVATLTAPYVMATATAEDGVADYMVEKSNAVLDAHFESFRAAVRAGVRIAMGTDQGTPLNRPGENVQEILRMWENGLSAAPALLSATAWAADLLRIAEDRGRLLPGLAADIIIVRGDPLADISILARPAQFAAVIKSGRFIRAALPGVPERGTA
ncbi:MAG TPA: amidohydrolase family protein [Tepidiformaceae bacterium]|nr:amidohydrolase family protein [Tepidiformaceae bacterium]